MQHRNMDQAIVQFTQIFFLEYMPLPCRLGRGEANQTKPNQTKPNQTKPNQTKPNQTGRPETTKPLNSQRLSVLVVEAAGIEPASRSTLQTVLHT